MKPKRVELTIPISEGDLLAMLLARYPTADLERMGIHSQSSVIRGLDIEPDGEGYMRCNFRVCAVSPVNTEAMLDAEAEKMRELRERKAEEEAQTTANLNEEQTVDKTAEQPTLSEGAECAAPCPASNLRSLRIEKQKKSSNS